MELLDLAIDLARGAGHILRDGRANGFGAIDTKSSSVDVVTETDKASERFIVDGIKNARPDDAIVGEEGTSIEGTTSIRWHVDPLDGTVNFIYGMPFYCVSIGIEQDGRPVAGAVYNPVLDEMFTASKGNGAHLNGAPISVNTVADTASALVGTGFSYDSNERKDAAEKLVAVLPEIRDLRRNGSAALDLCSVACGRIDAYFERFVNSWDVVAGIAIAEEAGAAVSGLSSDTWSGDQNIVAANPQLRTALIKLL